MAFYLKLFLAVKLLQLFIHKCVNKLIAKSLKYVTVSPYI